MAHNLTIEQCKEILEKSANQQVSNVEFKADKYSEQTIGFLGDHYKLTITGIGNNNNKCTHQYFMKTVPESSGKFQDYVRKMNFFGKEVAFYKEILPKIGQKHGMYAPNCLLATENFIVLEDLKPKNFVVSADFFNYNQCNSLLKSLAKMHTRSILYEESLSTNEVKYRLISDFEDALKEATFIFDMEHPRGMWLSNNLKAAIECLKIFPGCKNKVEVSNKLLQFVFNRLPDLAKPSQQYRNVVNHADLWKNNILFKEEDHQAIIVDFQFARYVPPVFDVLTALYLNVDRGFLESNFEALLNIYYGYFCTYLKMENVNPENIMPLNDFRASVEDYKMAAVIEAMFFGFIVFIGDKLAKDICSNENTFQEFTYDDRAKYVIPEYKNNPDYKYKLDTLLQRLVDVTMSL